MCQFDNEMPLRALNTQKEEKVIQNVELKKKRKNIQQEIFNKEFKSNKSKF